MKIAQKLGEPKPKRIVILRALQFGDLMCSVPALRALRSILPDAQITLIGLPWARSFVRRFHNYLDDFIEFPGYPGLPEQEPDIQALPIFLSEVQSRNFDLAFQMQGSGGVSNSLIELLGARLNAGFYLPGQYRPDEQRFLAYPVHDSEVNRHLQLMEFLGIPSTGDDKEFPLQSQDWEDFHEMQDRFGLYVGSFAVIHPGARALERRWPTAWFAAVADGLVSRGMRVILTGTHEEVHLTAAVSAQMRTPALDLAGQTSLGGLAAMLCRARILVCNDTGVSHLADALRIPSIVLFTASEPKRWAPHDQKLHRVIDWASAVLPDVVLDEVDELLHEERLYAAA